MRASTDTFLPASSSDNDCAGPKRVAAPFAFDARGEIRRHARSLSLPLILAAALTCIDIIALVDNSNSDRTSLAWYNSSSTRDTRHQVCIG
ncbi:hypothetical protein EJ02DRAFT_105393 [Clathrospora elynae]|uniref:Uncharacterized protein n=1 Tax=Clathrospora elynae TaxID=706981 RepID=A0A6A5SX58_9PLEO|nr:hypothetical protein EJ02DRAFT_105393 [Clathrospora elynae]